MLNLIYQTFLQLPWIATEIFAMMLIYTLFNNNRESKRYGAYLLLGILSVASIAFMRVMIPLTNPFLASSPIENLLIGVQTLCCLLVLFKLTPYLKVSSFIHKASCIAVVPLCFVILFMIGPLLSIS